MKKKIFVRAPFLSQSGYGEQSRFALRALRSREDLFDIYLSPIAWGKTGWVWENDEFRQWMDKRITATQLLIQKKALAPDISLQITIPNEFEKMCPINIGYTAGIETNKVAPIWLQKGNDMDKILVVSNHAKFTYENTAAEATNNKTGATGTYKLQTPVQVTWETTPRCEPEPIPNFDPEYDFNFLIVSQMGPRKNLKNTIRWWVEEFIDQPVGLIVKTNIVGNCIMDLQETEKYLQSVIKKYPDRKCKVHLLHGDLSSGQMTHLYNHEKIKAIIGLSHGEGFGLPLFEAAREGLPVVSMEWSGQCDFLVHDGKKYFQHVEYSIAPVNEAAVWDGVIDKNSMWAYADSGSYKMTLRKVYKNYEPAKETAEELKTIIQEKFSEEKLFKLFVDAIQQDSVLLEDEIESLFIQASV